MLQRAVDHVKYPHMTRKREYKGATEFGWDIVSVWGVAARLDPFLCSTSGSNSYWNKAKKFRQVSSLASILLSRVFGRHKAAAFSTCRHPQPKDLMMPKASKPGYYAVRIGRVPGIYLSWYAQKSTCYPSLTPARADCEAQVKAFPAALFKKLSTEAEAIEFMAAKPRTARTSATRDIVPVASTSRATTTPDSKAHQSHSTAEDENDCDIVYCDGACKGNGQPGSIAGIGVWWGHGDPRYAPCMRAYARSDRHLGTLQSGVLAIRPTTGQNSSLAISNSPTSVN